MKNRTAIAIWSIVGAIALGGIIYVAINWFEIVDSEAWVGAQGEAASNPFYALERTLEEMGAKVEKVQGTSQWQAALESEPSGSNGTLFIGDRRLARMTPARVRQLQEWVKAGGNLIIEAEQPGIDDPLLAAYKVGRVRLQWVKGELLPRPKRTDPGAPADLEEEEETPFNFAIDPQYDEEEAEPQKSSGKKTSERRSPFTRISPVTTAILPGAHQFKVSFRPYLNLVLDAANTTAWPVEDEVGLRLVQIRDGVGRGRVTIVSNFDFMAYRRLSARDHAEFVWHLVVANADGQSDIQGKPTVWLALRDPAGGLWTWLTKYAWMVVASLLVLLIAWIARIVPRFGPLVKAPAPSRLSLTEHLVAMGRYLGQKHAFVPLATVARERFLARMARESPALARMDLGALAAALEKQSGIGQARVRRALETAPSDRRTFVETIQTLRALEQHLRALPPRTT